jgi:ATP dependent DNA ligase C terminal region
VRPVEAGAGQQLDGAAVEPGVHAVAVIFDFVQPAVAVRRRVNQLREHWVRPELVAEVKFLTWTDDNLLRQVVYEGLREDKAKHPVPLVDIGSQALSDGAVDRHQPSLA